MDWKFLKKPSVIIVVFILLLIIASYNRVNVNWQEEYFEEVKDNSLEEYTKVPAELNTLNPEIESLVKEINSSAKNAEDAVKKVIDWTYYNIDYQPNTNIFCPSEKPDDVISYGTGNCVSMTKVNLVILSKLGFAVRPTSGCVSKQNTCIPMFAVEPGRVRQWVPATIEDNQLRGGLHLWLEVWLPNKGWTIIESTAGILYPKSCGDYDISAQSYDPYTMCYQSNLGYIQQCAKF